MDHAPDRLTPVLRRQVERRLRNAGRQLAEATDFRASAIVAAQRCGLSLRDIAENVGISYSGVDKIIKRHNGPSAVDGFAEQPDGNEPP